MSSSFPEDVYAEIANAISALPKGAKDEERAFLRALRDLTLLNLSLASREISSSSLRSLRRNVTLHSDPLTFLLHTKHLASPFVNTRSLIWDFSRQEEKEGSRTEAEEQQALDNEMKVAHPLLKTITREYVRLNQIVSSLPERWAMWQTLLPEHTPKELWASKLTVLSRTKRVSTVSTILECMPKLQYLQMVGGAMFQFVKLSIRKGQKFTRPLLGLSSLKVLRISATDNFVIYASNFIWLMIFLENLTHFEAFTVFRLEDKSFMLEHRKVLKEKSRVTHLDLSFMMMSEDESWPRSLGIEIQSLELVLQVTKGLKELKIHNMRRLSRDEQINQTPSIAFLTRIQSSFKTLQYLSLEGEFPHQPQGQYPANLIPIHLSSLELLAVNKLRNSALNFLVDFKAPSLKSIAFIGDSEGIEVEDLSEQKAVEWIGNPDFPASIETVFVDGEPIFKVKGSETRSFWKQCRKELIQHCEARKIEVKLLKAGEKLPFGVMPEPEDLL